ncbi:MAG: hypothetical protein GY830_07460 [Bacteroidetes bacterium]|nr:hypothetical protein [Bacteroidota bacterium]
MQRLLCNKFSNISNYTNKFFSSKLCKSTYLSAVSAIILYFSYRNYPYYDRLFGKLYAPFFYNRYKVIDNYIKKS